MASDIYAFLDLEGIEGEAQDPDYQDKIELQSFSWGAHNHGSFKHGTGGSTSKGQIAEISVSKFMCKASARLMERVTNGQHFPSGTLTLCKLSGDNKIAYYKVGLTDVLVTSYQVAATGGAHLPMESFTLHFAKVNVDYTPQGNEGDASGGVNFAWDLQKNAKA